MELGGFTHAALWMRPGAPFLCLEAWTGYSDPEGFEGELKDKPGMRMLAPRRKRSPQRDLFLHARPRKEPMSSAAASLVIDGRAASKAIIARVSEEALGLMARGIKPGLAVVLVGADPASQVYVRAKGKAAVECGFHSVQHDLGEQTSEAELLALVERLNADPAIHGILVQLPLPKAINSAAILEAIAPHKDVDGFHPINVGLTSIGEFRRALLALHAGGRDDPHRTRRSGARADARRARKPSSSAARTSSASRWRNCCSRRIAR